MKIKSIQIENFRQYRGQSSVEFATGNQDKVTVILGQNTLGKTTFVRAFAWCLYGGEAQDVGFKAKTNLLNEEVFTDLSEGRVGRTADMKVTLKIEMAKSVDEKSQQEDAHPVLYTISRHCRFEKKQKSVEKINERFKIKRQVGNENETEVDKADRNKIISSIMPKDLSQYFFYWGEQIENFDKKDLDKAISSFLGLDVYDKAIIHLNASSDSYRTDLIAQKKDVDITDLDSQIKKLDEIIKETDYKMSKERENVASLEETLKKRQSEFYKVENYEKDKEKLEKLNQSLGGYEKSYTKALGDFRKSFNARDLPTLLTQSKAEYALKILHENAETSTGWVNVSEMAIDEILMRGVCVCGTTLEGREDLKQHLKDEKRNALPNSLGGYVDRFSHILSTSEQNLERYLISLAKDFREIGVQEGNVLETRNDIEEQKKNSWGEQEYLLKKKAVLQAQDELDKAKQRLWGLDYNQKENVPKKRNLEKKLSDELAKEKRRNKTTQKMELTNAVLAAMKDKRKSRDRELRDRLVDLTQTYFDQIYSGKRTIEITDTFKLKVINKVGNSGVKKENETSPGLDAVKNFAFIAALITIAKETLKSKSKDSSNMEPYPLVLDAPFSQVDDQHIANICEMLVNEVDQTIFVMMEKDWRYAQDKIGPYTSEYYRIKKITETNSVIEKIDDPSKIGED